MRETRESGVGSRESLPARRGAVPPPRAVSTPDSRLPTSDSRELWICSLGLVPYAQALELQRVVARARIAGQVPQDVLILLEHPPVVTLGRTAKAGHLVASGELLRERGVELFEIERGGDVTFHGPGQLVGYPIVDLKRHRQDLHWYLRQVEEALMRALHECGVSAERSPGLTGVWTRGADGGPEAHARGEGGAGRPRKIASIGVHARDWVTWHGFALNVTTDLSYFGLIVPCGIDGVVMTTLARELGRPDLAMAPVERAVTRAFGDVFALEPRQMAPEALLAAAAT